MEFEKAIARVYDLRQMAKQYEAEAKEILASIDFDEERHYLAGHFIAQVSRTRKFDPATAERNLTPEELAATLVTRPDSELAKRVLSPERYAAAQKEYGFTVRIVPAEET